MDHAAETLIALDELILAAKLLRTRVESGTRFGPSEPVALVRKAAAVQYHSLRTQAATTLFPERRHLPNPDHIEINHDAATQKPFGGHLELLLDLCRDTSDSEGGGHD